MQTSEQARSAFRASRTSRSLISAYQGESQARRQYLNAAQRCDEAALHVAAYAFSFTAAQEKEHAAIFHGLLCAYGGDPVHESVEDVPLPGEPLSMLEAVSEGEAAECDRLYPAYAQIAAEEGYPRIATAFRRIAETERLHARRFRQYAQALRDGTLLCSPESTGWLCLACGHLHYGLEAPHQCGTCARDQGHFIRSDFQPFTVSP